MIRKLAIFGVGLIGGSLALALKQKNACGSIVGCSRNEEHLAKAVELGAIDSYTTNPAEAVEGADVVLLAVPLGAMKPVLDSIKNHLSDDCIVTDAGSSKSSVVADAAAVFGGQCPDFFVPGHPIAGREKSGVTAALPSLYENHKVILTPLAHTDPTAVSKIKQMWEVAGATVQSLEVEQHDLVLAATSHLPHVVAYSLVDTIAKTDFVEKIFEYAAGGFRDSSRTASSDPVMWRDICLQNRDAILDVISDFQLNLAGLKELIENSDGEKLMQIFANAKNVRDANVMKASPHRE